MMDELPDLTPLGYYNFRHQQKKFGIKIDDRRRHIYVVGKTGVGKTTLLENMAIADIRSGKGIAFVDPHGESAEKMLDFVPEERLDDVIYFDPSDMEYPIAFNPMEQVGTEFRHLVASGLMGVFKKIWADAWSARMEYILNNTLLALLENPGSTLLGILRMFSKPNYRKQIVDNLQDPVIKAFWQNEFSRYSQKFETEALAAIQNKVGQFVSNPLIRNILGQPRSSLNMREIMDSGKDFHLQPFQREDGRGQFGAAWRHDHHAAPACGDVARGHARRTSGATFSCTSTSSRTLRRIPSRTSFPRRANTA